jgi:hypothetical protein
MANFTSQQNPISVTVNENYTVTAVFEKTADVCSPGFIGDAYCKNGNLYRLYQYDDCSEEERLIQSNADECGSQVSPTPTPTPTPPSSVQVSPTPTRTNTPLPSPTPTNTPFPSVTPSVTPPPGASPTPSVTPQASQVAPPPDQPTTCPPGFVGDPFCKGNDLYREYVRSDCGREDRLLEVNSPTCVLAPPPPPPSNTPAPTPPPSNTPAISPTPTPSPVQWRNCVDGQLYTGYPPSDYRAGPFEGVSGGICWEPVSEIGITPSLEKIRFIHKRGSGETPASNRFVAQNPSYILSYKVTLETNADYFVVTPAEFLVNPRQSVEFQISINDTRMEEFGDGVTVFNLDVTIEEI